MKEQLEALAEKMSGCDNEAKGPQPGPTPSPFSMNNRLILAAYTGDRSLKAKETSGFAMLSQKVNLVALKVLVNTRLADGTHVRAGDTAYLKEEMVFTQVWGKTNLECPAIEGKFIIVDATFIELVVPA